MKKLVFIFVLFSTIVLGTLYFLLTKPPQIQRAETYSLHWEECWFPTPLLRPIHCGFLQLDSEAKIPIVVVRHSFFRRNLNPLLFINGGPGSSTILSSGKFEDWPNWLDSLQSGHDLVLFDYLGTGFSEPSYDCPVFSDAATSILSQSLTSDVESEKYGRIAKDCFEQLKEDKRDLTKLTLPYQLEYISKIIKAFPDVDWDIYGVSYGTKVILALLQNPPKNVEKVVLDGVLPLEIDSFQERASLLDRALKNLFHGCKSEFDCQHDFPELETKFYKLVNTLQRDPIQFIIVDPQTKEKITVVINGHRLISLVYLSLYEWDLLRQLPHALSAALEGDIQPLFPMVQALSWYYLDEDWSDAMFITVGCSQKRAEVNKETFIHSAKAYPRLVEYLKGMWMLEACDFWDVPKIHEKYHHSVKTHIPGLLLSGTYDPITPAEWARKVKEKMSNSILFEFSGIGHGAVMSDRCAGEVMREFLLDRGDLRIVSCLKFSHGPTFLTKTDWKK